MTRHHPDDSFDSRPEFPSPRAVRLFYRVLSSVASTFFVVVTSLTARAIVNNFDAIRSSFAEAAELTADFAIELDFSALAILLLAAVSCVLAFVKCLSARPVYLLDFAAYKPPEHLKVRRRYVEEAGRSAGLTTEESLAFQMRVAARSGLGDETYLPPAHHDLSFAGVNMDSARKEAEMVMFGAVEQLMKQTGLRAQDVDILVVNCSLFNPTPSLSAMIVNHFKLRSDVLTYNLSGMGCSAGVIAIGLAQELLQVYPNKNALVVSTENITQNWYLGNERSMLIPNVLFRMGASAVLLSNKRSCRHQAKYRLQHVVRVHQGAQDKAYRCVYQRPDSEGHVGVELNKDLLSVASKALAANMTRTGRLVLPWTEQLLALLNIVAIRYFKCNVGPYVPDFKRAFQHFCIHAGGRSVIEGIAHQLQLPPSQTDPSFQTLHWYGNTSSSSIWYALAYIETCQSVKKGDVVWQIGFGSGFKCNSAVWKAIRDVDDAHVVWKHRIGKPPSPVITPLSNAKPE